MDYTVHGILQARILEWVAFPFLRESSKPKDRTQVSDIESGFFFFLNACGILAPGVGIEPAPPALKGEMLTTGPPGKSLKVDSLPAESQGKPKNTGVGNLILLQQIFLIQELK